MRSHEGSFVCMKNACIRICFFLFVLPLCAQDSKQLFRHQIDLNKSNDDFPLIYLGMNNAFHVLQYELLDSLELIADSLFVLSNKQSGDYNIESPRYFSLLPALPGDMSLIAHFKNGPAKMIQLRAAYIPPVQVSVYLDDHCINDEFIPDSVYSCDRIQTRAKLIYPEHVHGYMRFRGVHEAAIFAGNKSIAGIVGWYDAGDNSQVYNLPSIQEEMELIILEDKLKCLAFGPVFGNGQKTLIYLTSTTPRKIRMRKKGHWLKNHLHHFL